MDADLISYESMLAARDSANWAFWGMVAAFISAAATACAVGVAVRAISGWKKQETAQEIKNINLSLFRFQMQVQLSRYEFNPKNKDLEEAKEAMSLLKGLDSVYECTITMHNKELQNQSSELYSELVDIFNDFVNGKINREEITKRLVAIRGSNPVLKTYV